MAASSKVRLPGRLVPLADIKGDAEFESLQLPRAPEDLQLFMGTAARKRPQGRRTAPSQRSGPGKRSRPWPRCMACR